MTTLGAARTALVSAVSALSDATSGTGCVVYSNGSNMQLRGDGSALWQFRVTCYVGYQADSAQNSKDLATLVAAKLVILLSLAGWQIDSVSPDVVRSIAGGDHLSADIAVTTTVTFS